MRHRQQARFAVVALLAPTLVGLGATRATATTPTWLTEANHLRTFWNVSVPTLTEDSTLSANDLAHDNYLDHNNTCGHTEDTGNPYYTAAGAYGGSHSVVYCTALGPVNDVDGWSTTPLHGEQVLNPQLTVTGFAETSLNGGHAAMDTLTNASGAAAPAVAATWPNGTDFPFTHFAGGEIDYTGGDAVVDNCGPPYSDDQSALGAPLFVELPGAAHNAVPASASDYFLKDGNGTSIPVCLFDATSPVSPSSTAVMLPLHAFNPAEHYTASYKAGGITATWSFTVGAQPPAPPTAVHVASSGNHTASLTWTAPSSSGGSAITGYHVQQYDASAASPAWVDATDTADSSTATSTTVTGLTNSHFYYFMIAGKNAKGTGAYSEFSDNAAYPQPGPPAAPTGVAGLAGAGKVTVSWTPPSDNGGASITGYDVQYSTNDGGSWTSASSTFHTSTATTQDVTGLTNGTAYKFRVAAINTYGTGTYSAKSAAYTPTAGATAPGQPTNVSGVAGEGKVAVSWTAPGSTGGSAILGYDVQYSSNSGGSWSSASSAFHTDTTTTQDVTGLTNGTSYVFRVAAINGIGTGLYSNASSPVTPTGAGSLDQSVMTTKTSKAAITYGQPDAVGVALGDVTSGQPIVGATITLMGRPASGQVWSQVTEQVTGAGGGAGFAVHPQHNTEYEWTYAGDAQHASAASSVVPIAVRQLVTATAKDHKVKKGDKVVISGSVKPAGSGSVQLQVKKHHTWSDLHQPVTVISGHFTISFKPATKGAHTYRMHRDGTATTAAGNSPEFHVRLT
jgi:hypothetical protein